MNQKDREDKVKNSLETIRPSLQNDGGDLEFIKMEGDNVFLKLTGSCAGCPYSTMTVKNGIENMLHHNVDEKINVINMQP